MTRPPGTFVPRADRVEINREFKSVDAFINEYVSNISRSGAFIRSKDPLPVGTKVNLKFTVLMQEIETIEGIGEVVRVQVDPPGMGVVFVTLTARSQHLIDKLITRRRSGGGRTGTKPGVGAEAPKPGRRAGTRPPPPPPEAFRKR